MSSDNLMAVFWELVVATRLEMCLFVVAVLAYFALFGNMMPKGKKSQATGKGKSFNSGEEPEAASQGGPLSKADREQAERSFATAHESNNYRGALTQWNVLKRSEVAPKVSIVHAVECMQRVRKDAQYVIRELKAFMKKHPEELDMRRINELFEALSKRMDSDLVGRIVALLPSVGLKPDERSYEIFLSMQFSLRRFREVEELVAEMKVQGIAMSMRAKIVVLKTAFKQNDLNGALEQFKDLVASWPDPQSTPSAAPRHIVSQLVDLVCKEHQLALVLPVLRKAPLNEEVVHAMLAECASQRNAALALDVEAAAREQGIAFAERTYAVLLKALAGDRESGLRIFAEAFDAQSHAAADAATAEAKEPSAELALAGVAFCAQHADVPRADALRQRLGEALPPAVNAAFIRFYIATEHFEKACAIYDEAKKQGRPCIDTRLERAMMTAALRCGRSDLASGLLEASPSDVAKHITMIRNCAAEGNLSAAVEVFEALKNSGVEMNSVIYNTVIDACVECGDLRGAERWMKQTQDVGLADVVSYNTLIKAHLAGNHFNKARSLMEEMTKNGMQPNRVTFNELINAVVTKGGGFSSRADRAEMWSLVDEMQRAGVTPNQVTCSILMKSLNKETSETELLKAMDLISAMEEPMDEVLLSSVVEACVRIGKPDLVANKLKQLQSDTGVVNGSHTFGSLIKAYGFAKDMDGVWRCWKEMRSRHIRPTSVTLGCMVEAVVNNGDTEGAYELIHQIRDDDRCKDVLNSVIYCSVLKGFAREKNLERAWVVYEEMVAQKVDLSIVTFNTLADACARCGRMDRVPAILEGMKKFRIKANVITYSTMLKGHCQAGDIRTAFALVDEMRANGLKPDEIMYNSLLDGCAQSSLVDDGLRLLEEMQQNGITPSNFTLSVLVKLMSRARRLDSAFDIVAKITTQYNFRPNVHVYTNLIQACISNKALGRATGILEQMVKERVQPENRTYNILLRAYISQNNAMQADGLLRAALGLPGAPAALSHQAARCWNLDNSVVNETLVGLPDKEMALALLSDIRRQCPKVRIEGSTQRRLMTAGGNDGYDGFAAPRGQGRMSQNGGGFRARGGASGGRY
eukprot:TRINITY_DN55872_c0_g1_i1.p1 TRINITY_DN55872_c0_g1~~TRINITY_DN55872_c0_g1_i1.p1  ORF type:complete len:1146 (+),score=317.10 TRINITY_DN55872_c0_g1_i1:158-3439(+)